MMKYINNTLISSFIDKNSVYHPLITVVTVVFNGAKYIEHTIQSVLNQSYSSIEYVVIDGGSTDDTLDVIKQYDYGIDYWVSELDDGISDAMNKGVKVANGEYIIFLHSDDFFYSDESLNLASQYLSGNHDIVACDILYGEKMLQQSPRGFNFWLNFKTGILHQGAICHRSVFKQVGCFDKSFRIVMDYDFFLRAYRNKISVKRYSIILSVMRDTGISSQKGWLSIRQRFAEERKVHMKNCPNKVMMWSYLFYWYIYILYRKIIYKIS